MLIASRPTLRHSALAVATLARRRSSPLVAVAPAASAKTAAKCAKEVIADWYDNGRVDKIYPQHCYREAIKILPVDVRDYSSARDDILRALAYAQQGKPDPGDPASGTNGGTGTGSGTGGTGSGTGGTAGTGGPGDTPGGTGESPVDTSGPSAVPIPLIVLAAIAALLLVLGATGYFTRRAAGRGARRRPGDVARPGPSHRACDADDLGSVSITRRTGGSIVPVHSREKLVPKCLQIGHFRSSRTAAYRERPR